MLNVKSAQTAAGSPRQSAHSTPRGDSKHGSAFKKPAAVASPRTASDQKKKHNNGLAPRRLQTPYHTENLKQSEALASVTPSKRSSTTGTQSSTATATPKPKEVAVAATKTKPRSTATIASRGMVDSDKHRDATVSCESSTNLPPDAKTRLASRQVQLKPLVTAGHADLEAECTLNRDSCKFGLSLQQGVAVIALGVQGGNCNEPETSAVATLTRRSSGSVKVMHMQLDVAPAVTDSTAYYLRSPVPRLMAKRNSLQHDSDANGVGSADTKANVTTESVDPAQSGESGFEAPVADEVNLAVARPTSTVTVSTTRMHLDSVTCEALVIHAEELPRCAYARVCAILFERMM